ncbi:hypothetical protein ADUPG1_011613, partial [Aduncisulcus paluster]
VDQEIERLDEKNLGIGRYSTIFIPSQFLLNVMVGKAVILQHLDLPSSSAIDTISCIIDPDSPSIDIPQDNSKMFEDDETGNPYPPCDGFRLFATCSENYLHGNSNVTNKFTVIGVPTYFDSLTDEGVGDFVESVLNCCGEEHIKALDLRSKQQKEEETRIAGIKKNVKDSIFMILTSIKSQNIFRLAISSVSKHDISEICVAVAFLRVFVDSLDLESRKNLLELLKDYLCKDNDTALCVIPGFMDLLSETEKKELNDRLQSTHHQHQHHHHHHQHQHQHQHQPILGEGEEPEEEEGMFPDVVQSRPILDEDEEEGGDDDNLDKGQNEISPDNADDTEEDPEIHIPENTFSRYIHAGKLLGNKRVTIHSKVSCVSTNVIPIPASKISRIRHETTEELFADSDFVLGPNISNVIDVLVTGLASRIPVFLESAPGQGKSAVVEHFAKSIGLDFKRLNFSNSTTVDSLFGYVASVRGEDGYPKFETIPGTLKKYIDSTSRKDKSVSNPCPRMVLLLDEINLAPPEVFDILIPLFGDSLEKSITLPDGSPCDVSHVMVVATLNPQELSGARMRIPPMVRESVLYTTIPSYSMDELIQIAKGKPHADTRYLEEKYLESTTMIHKACLDYCAKNGLTNSLSLREIIKVS